MGSRTDPTGRSRNFGFPDGPSLIMAVAAAQHAWRVIRPSNTAGYDGPRSTCLGSKEEVEDK